MHGMSPGRVAIVTGGTRGIGALEKVMDSIPMRRLGHAWEVARAVRFLPEEDSGYITGAVFAINGGLEM